MTKKQNADIFPSYHDINAAKDKCYPKTINLDESKVKIDLECLLHHTIYRILDIKEVEVKVNKVLSKIAYNENIFNCVLHCICGFDWATGQAEYKQGYTDINNNSITERSLLSTSFVPLSIEFIY